MPTSTVNNNLTIKTDKEISYYQCFKLSDSQYVIFDAKMDMPLYIGSLNVIKSMNLPQGSLVYYYEPTAKFYFAKTPDLYIKIEGQGKHTKPPLRYNYMDEKKLIYHHFKLTPVLSVLFDDRFDMPLAYGSNQRVFAVINKIPKADTVFYYKEDLNYKNSFKLYMTYEGKSSNR